MTDLPLPSPETLSFVNRIKARIEILPADMREQWATSMQPHLDKALADLPGTHFLIDGTVVLADKAHEPQLQATLRGLLAGIDDIIDKNAKDMLPLSPTARTKTYKHETMVQMQALKDRVALLPEHVRVVLEERWRKRDGTVRVRIDTTNDQLISPLTVEDEEAFQEELTRGLAEVEDELVKHQYSKNAAHVIALEQQLLAYRVNAALVKLLDHRKTALQKATVETLRTAMPYCWAPSCVEAVSHAASMLDLRSKPQEANLGEFGPAGTSGWWWFEKPIPIKTVVGGESIVALAWRREYRENVTVLDALGGEQEVPGPVSMTWFNAFVHEPVTIAGRSFLAPNPTLAWIWVDSVDITGLAANVLERYREMDVKKSAGMDALPAETVAQSAVWLSKFWLAGCMWLQERVVLGRQSMGLPRQQGRQLQRQYDLPNLPMVEVVYLRRAEPTISEGTGGNRDYHVRWLVREHIRRQWYPSLGKHQLCTVKAHVKGPADKPLKTAAKVYAVNR